MRRLFGLLAIGVVAVFGVHRGQASPIPVQIGFDNSLAMPFNVAGSLQVDGVTAITWTTFSVTSGDPIWVVSTDTVLAGAWGPSRQLAMTISVKPGFVLDLSSVAVGFNLSSNGGRIVQLSAGGTAGTATWNRANAITMPVNPPEWAAGDYAVTIAPTTETTVQAVVVSKFLFAGEITTAIPEPAAALLLLGAAPVLLRRPRHA